MLSTFLILTSYFPLNAEERVIEGNIEEGARIINLDDNYIGFFMASSKVRNKLVDLEGFANWGHPGSSVNYNDYQFAGGMLVGFLGPGLKCLWFLPNRMIKVGSYG